METTKIIINNEDQVPEELNEVINQVTDNVSKAIEETIDEEQPTTTTTTENPIVEENIEKDENDDDEVVPSTTPKPIEEQENVTETNTAVSTSLSPSRMTVPFKEVNESEKEESSPTVNGTENINNKKRELDNEDEPVQEKIVDNNEQTKKIKITESIDSSTLETNESENNIIVNGTSAVEV